MSYSAEDWMSRLTVRPGVSRLPGAQKIGYGRHTYYVVPSGSDPQYRREVAEGQALGSLDKETREQRRARERKAAALFTELWERRMAGEQLEDIAQVELGTRDIPEPAPPKKTRTETEWPEGDW